MRLYRGDESMSDTGLLPLPGRHNREQSLRGADDDRRVGPGRRRARCRMPARSGLCRIACRSLGTRDGITYVNDSISTTPHASLAALDVFGIQRVAMLARRPRSRHRLVGFADAMRTARRRPS